MRRDCGVFLKKSLGAFYFGVWERRDLDLKFGAMYSPRVSRESLYDIFP